MEDATWGPVKPLTREELAQLDPGIRQTVVWLRSLGFDTTDSGDGVTKVDEMECAESTPNVYMVVEKGELVARAEFLHHKLVKLIGLPIFDEDGGPNWGVQGVYLPGQDDAAVVELHGVNDDLLMRNMPS